ncbi:hypothetical protein J0J37_22775, partial [Vibrio vulnificus]|uniref:hypothetical protein n=1 Tax=Vibrio vulnificus TaxID=672 RepID=UPI0019D4DB63
GAPTFPHHGCGNLESASSGDTNVSASLPIENAQEEFKEMEQERVQRYLGASNQNERESQSPPRNSTEKYP